MFSRTVTLAIAVMPLLAAAYPSSAGEPPSSCSTGDLQCCDSTQTASSPAALATLALLGIVLQDLNVLVGLTCSPITVIGVGSGSCSATAVCCEDNSHGGLISIGCVPVTL